ncbi:MAG: leucine-rich repeat domain-containing protein [Muribaculaceae bacterium]|nr:leucine-rich repeat domain-containing protein [Muribaculaceae bacterium]
MSFRQFTAFTVVLVMIIAGFFDACGERRKINRSKFDFTYQDIDYQILSKEKKTVAVCQYSDNEFALFSRRTESQPGQKKKSRSKAWYPYHDITPNGHGMDWRNYCGRFLDIPQTVYDDNDTAYTVTDLADGAIDWVGIGILVLPPTLERLNGGITGVDVNEIYLPEGLKEIDGIVYCPTLKSLHIPGKVEVIRSHSLSQCGFESLYLPPSVKILEDFVLAFCENLEVAKLSGVETMGKYCFKKCPSYTWANLPETLRSMGEGCFDECPELDLVSLPWSEIKMDGCFNGCPSISRIEVLATDPYPFPKNSFRDVDRSSCIISVPKGSEEKYRNAVGWKEFQNIVGELPALEKPKGGRLQRK